MLYDERPLKLNEETAKVLDEAKAGTAPVKATEEQFEGRLKAILAGSGLPRIYVTQYGWFLSELGRIFRTRTGRELGFHLELCIRKWLNLGLESRTIQFLVCEAFYILKAARLTTKTQSHKEVGQDGLGQEVTTKTPSHQKAAADQDVTTKHALSGGEGTQSH